MARGSAAVMFEYDSTLKFLRHQARRCRLQSNPDTEERYQLLGNSMERMRLLFCQPRGKPSFAA
jgi:hypothetical protein